ncbi:ATP-binding protein [Sediminibacterium sp.]|jgi:two-component system, OmpR family, sensor histidine kinase CiaH|uniref:sensor histidine kinase n=1 Tax=Sediminibacterium sp. TaxID=1917865 RepID=UPI0025FCA8E6|nr:ATP-binding protein [Sediminibacterium sp.]MBW0178932.1 two-component sensor histidine kinase [Sediminibacterium sp.]
MTSKTSKRLTVVTVVYWILLSYIVAALIWWFIALEKQNRNITNVRLLELLKDDPQYFEKATQIEAAKKRKTAQYVGEGVTFLALILVGAVFVFRATRRQLLLSQQQQNFMMAVTHELKTPIAVTRLNLETLQKRKLDEEKQQKLIVNTLQEANRLNMLCNNILLAAQLDAGAYTTTKEEINFSDLVEGCIDDFRNRFPQRAVSENIGEGLYLNGEQLLLQMLVNNLLENAMKYSPKESLITITLKADKSELELTVSDEGIGIADDEKRKIFDKFYRVGNENTRSTKGTGLGLYLCSRIVKSHNGYISVTDNQPQGSNFAVTLQQV